MENTLKTGIVSYNYCISRENYSPTNSLGMGSYSGKAGGYHRNIRMATGIGVGRILAVS